MPKFCHHIGIFTDRPKGLRNFYIRKIGFKPDSVSEINAKIIKRVFGINKKCTLSRLKLEGVRLELFSCPGLKFKKNIAGSSGYNHWAMNVPDKAGFCNRLGKKGVKIIKVKRGNYYTYFIRDPQRNLIEIRDDKI